MKPAKPFTGILGLLLLLLAAVGCERDLTQECDDAVFTVLNDDGSPLSTRQTLNFNTKSTWKIEAKNVRSTEVSVPAGWGCEVDVPARSVTIVAPDGAHRDAAVEGDILIEARGVNGSTARRTIPVEAVEAEIVLESDTDLAEPVSLAYGESVVLAFRTQNVERIALSETIPAGWRVALDGADLKITAPDATDESAEERGEVTLTPYSRRGSKGASSVVRLVVSEAPIEMTCNEPIDEPIAFRLGDTQTFTFRVSSNVADVRLSEAPAGWTLQPDLKRMALTVAAPKRPDEGIASEGEVVLTPISNRGTEGEPLKIRILLNLTVPVLEFDVVAHRFELGESLTIHAVRTINVKDVSLKSAPAGWNIVPDFGGGSCVLTAPQSAEESVDAAGRFIFTATSTKSDETADVEVEVKLKGLHDAADMLSFGDAVATGRALDDYLLDGCVNLFADIDLSAAGRSVLIGADGKPFAGHFDGNGHTLTLGITAAESEAGLFHTLGAGATVEHLRLAGAITSGIDNARVGGVAIYNDGAALNDVRSAVNFTSTVNKNGGYYGGLVAYVRQSGARFADCHTSGTVVSRGIKYMGGLIGCIEADSRGEMIDCSNTGAMALDYGALDMGGAHVAGAVGCTAKSKWTLTRVSNTGDIRYQFGKSNKAIYALGGAFGSACGTFVDCFNGGDVLDTDGDETVSGTRRIGGFAGASAEAGYPLVATGCYNEGRVIGCSNYIGGFVGTLEKSTAAAPHLLTDCYNAGSLRVVSRTSISGMFGGFIAVSYQYTTLTRCANRGRVIGYTNRSAAGLVGCGADFLTVNGCKNTGSVWVGCKTAVNPKAGRPFVAGLVAIRGTKPVKIGNSENTGEITAMVQAAADVQSAYVSEIVTVDGKQDVTECDQETLQASAAARVTPILKDAWDATPPPEL